MTVHVSRALRRALQSVAGKHPHLSRSRSRSRSQSRSRGHSRSRNQNLNAFRSHLLHLCPPTAHHHLHHDHQPHQPSPPKQPPSLGRARTGAPLPARVAPPAQEETSYVLVVAACVWALAVVAICDAVTKMRNKRAAATALRVQTMATRTKTSVILKLHPIQWDY
eukprot:COSAG06_NODE_2329_length_7075_cov_2.524799_3_plen_165_part_00